MEAHALRAGAHGGHAKVGSLRRIASDDRLVARVRSGDARAFEALFERYQRPILSFCRHMLGSAEEAEDAAQHTFLAAYNGITGSERHIHLRAWLYTIARNHCLSQLRARREQRPLEDVEPAVEGLAAEVQRRADLRDMLRDLARLPEDQRAALVLSELGDLSHDEIAEVVGCRREKVRALVFQARSSLSASRQARETSCQEIREQLATLSGGALRRTGLRRHLRDCTGCREFAGEVKRQRGAMALVLPVIPSAGLKTGVLSGIGAGGAVAGAGVGGTGGLAALLANVGASKVAVAVVVAAGAAGGGVATVDAIEDGARKTTPVVAPAPSESAVSTRVALTGSATPAGVEPTRAGGAHAPGKQSGGVANGKNAKGERGRSETAPGRAGTSPGRAGTSPGLARTTPGRSRANRGSTKSRRRAPLRRRNSPAPPPRAESAPAKPAPPPQSNSGGNSTSAPAQSRPEAVLPDLGGAVPKAR